MTPDELATWMRDHDYLDELGRLGSTKLSGNLGLHRSTVLKWLSGELEIKPQTILALETLSLRHQQNKPRRRRPAAAATA